MDEKETCEADGEVMCGGLSLKEILERHKKWLSGEEGGERAYLRCANLHGANLHGADLSGANLSDSNLHGADLSEANLHGANMSGANMNGVNLHGANMNKANLIGANLHGANLSHADLSGANLRDCPVTIPNIHSRVYESASQPGCLDMRTWHTCETTHCRAGWVIALAGDAGRALEWVMGTPAAAAIIYMASDPGLEKIPDFYCSNEEALADMKRLAELEAAKKNPNGGAIVPPLNPQPGAGYESSTT